MIKSEELRDLQSCLNKAGRSEPIFILRAKDPIASMAIRHWATMAYGLHEPSKIKEARDFADAMDDWLNAPKAPEPLPPCDGNLGSADKK